MQPEHLLSGWFRRQLATLASDITSGGTPQSGNPRYYTESGGFLFAKIDDLTAAKGRYLSDTFLHVTPAALRDTALKLYPPGTILLSMYGTVGLIRTTRVEMTANQALAALLPPFSCNPDYLAHTLIWSRPRWEKYKSQTTQANINGRTVKNFECLLPPLPEQRRIAEILDTLDETIRKTEDVIAKLQQMKQGLLHDLLTRGIDDNGELRDPERHPEQFKDSPLGRIPREWEVGPLGNSIAFITDYRGMTPPYTDEGIPVISAENVGGGKIKSTTKWVSPETYRRTTTRGFPEADDTIFTTEAPVAEVARLPGDCTYRLTRRVIALRPKESVQKHYLYWYMFRLSETGAWSSKMHGSTVPRILKPDILNQSLLVPPLSEQTSISDVLDSHQSRIDNEVSSLGKLRTLKHGLMNDLLTGRVRVSTESPA